MADKNGLRSDNSAVPSSPPSEDAAAQIRYAPTKKTDIYYPVTDGKPMAETERHRYAIMHTLQVLQIPGRADGSVASEVLNLDLPVLEDRLGFYHPVSEKWLEPPAEMAETRAEHEATRAEQESTARHQAEAELTRLRAENERLKVSVNAGPRSNS